MSEKATQRVRKVTEKSEFSTVIKIGKTDAGVLTTTTFNKRARESFQTKVKELTADTITKLSASQEPLDSQADLLTPPENPNRRPTRINADRSLSRMKARDRALVGRGH
ncbi:hypothetical protein [Planococcus donghaensis]|uniref:hypothetical protein n=1 Tax=Planococcus donghaensis TaxID=414778 RepID=UPI003735C235